MVARDEMARRVFRANPAYEVVPFDRLASGERASIAEFTQDPDFFGVLKPRAGSGGTIKAVSRNVALLVYALAEPGPIPRQAVAGGDDAILDAAWRLALDGVLEVEMNGAFVSGAGALAGRTAESTRGAIARLSDDALRLITQIPAEGALELAERLYHYNRRPLTPAWVGRLRTPGEVLRFAGAPAGSPAAALLERHWKTKATDVGDPWISWWPRITTRNPRRMGDADVTWKLYVSPAPEALPEALPALVAVLAEAGAPPFKLGAGPSGILRPDKVVIYFATRRAAEEVARVVATRFRAMSAQPVPFTEDLGRDGLVSLGMDPPAGRAMLDQVGASWRQWICRRMASYVCVAQRNGRAADADRFALDRIALDGVDSATWAPSESAVRGFAAGVPA